MLAQTLTSFFMAVTFYGRFSSTQIQKLNRMSLVFVNKDNELVLLQVANKGNVTGCDNNGVFRCNYKNTVWQKTDFRTTNLIEGVVYVNEEINISQIVAENTIFFDLNKSKFIMFCICCWNTRYRPVQKLLPILFLFRFYSKTYVWWNFACL